MPTPTKTPSPKQNAPSPRRRKLFKCGQTSCPGLGIPTDLECIMCGVCLHSFCVAEANREIEAAGAEVIEGDNLCSMSCYRFRKADVLTSEVVKAERTLLMKKNKEQLKKEGRELNIKVNCRVNGASCDAPKEIIVARLLEKKMLALCPSLEVVQEVIATASRVTIHD